MATWGKSLNVGPGALQVRLPDKLFKLSFLRTTLLFTSTLGVGSNSPNRWKSATYWANLYGALRWPAQNIEICFSEHIVQKHLCTFYSIFLHAFRL